MTTVECRHCGAAYDTNAPDAAIREVPRCQECGVVALVIVADEEPVADED